MSIRDPVHTPVCTDPHCRLCEGGGSAGVDFPELPPQIPPLRLKPVRKQVVFYLETQTMTLDDLARRCESLREEALFGGDSEPVEDAGLDAMAEQELLSCLAYLELAQRAARRADIHQTRALVVSPYRG